MASHDPAAGSRDLRKIPLFASANPALFKELSAAAEFEVCAAGSVFAKQGEFKSTFYVLLSGGVTALRTEPDGSVEILDALGAGDWFGEMSALSHQPCVATLKAETTCVLVVVPDAVFKKLYDHDPEFRRVVDEKYRQRSLVAHLRLAPVLRKLSDEELARIRPDVRFERHPAGHTIASRGRAAEAIYLVRSGAVKKVAGEDSVEHVLGYYMTNSSFGARAFVEGEELWLGDYVTMTSTDVLVVPRAVIRRHFGRESDALRRVTAAAAAIVAEERGENLGFFDPGTGGQRQLGADQAKILVGRGSVKGGEALVIDLRSCVRCNACVESCVAVHDDGVPRLSKRGNRISLEGDSEEQHSFNLSTSCYNCQIPGCMLNCNFGAIRRDLQGLIRFDSENCVGCAMCVDACPYDVIRLTPSGGGHDAERSLLDAVPLLGKLLRRAKRTTAAEPAPAGGTGVKAVKCDLCAGLPFEACVYNCPCSAIVRMSPEKLFELGGIDSAGTYAYSRKAT